MVEINEDCLTEARRIACDDYKIAPQIIVEKATIANYHRLMTEGWRPEPKVDPAMEIWVNAYAAYYLPKPPLEAAQRQELAAKVITDAIAQAVADARVKVPADIRWQVGRSHTAVTQFINTLIAAEDGQ